MAKRTPTRNTIDEKVVDNLIRKAQRARSESVRAKAIDELWGLCENFVMNVAVGKSYRLDSDFSLHGMTPVRRCEELSIEMFLRFRECALNFNPSFGNPFLAWAAQNIGWQLLSDKRDNSNRREREKKCAAYAYCCHGEDLLTGEANYFAQGRDNKRLIAKCRKVIKEQAPKLLRAFDAMEKDSKENGRCCDTRVAEALGCTKVYAGILRKKIIDILTDNGMEWAQDSIATTIGVPQYHEYSPDSEPPVYGLPGCSPYVYKDKARDKKY